MKHWWVAMKCRFFHRRFWVPMSDEESWVGPCLSCTVCGLDWKKP